MYLTIFLGGNILRVTPLPIPNREVKPFRAFMLPLWWLVEQLAYRETLIIIGKQYKNIFGL